MSTSGMRDSLSGLLRDHRVAGWDGNRAEPLPCVVYDAASKLVKALPEGNFELGKRGTSDICLVWAEIHHAAHEDTPVFRFYAKPEMFGPSYFAITVTRDGKYAFDFEEGKTRTQGITTSETWVVKMLMDHLSDLGDLMLEE